MLVMLVVMTSLLRLPVISAASVGVQPDRAVSPGIAAQREAMKKLEWLAGDWEGDAKFDLGRGGGEEAWMKIRQSEAVRMKISGRVLLIKGTGRTADGRTVFNALATVSHDPETKEYRMRAFGHEGAVDPKIEVGEKSVVWGFTTRTGRVRYTVKLDEQGRWAEIGERSGDDGKTWSKFIDMSLERMK